MVRTHIFRCDLNRERADLLNKTSGDVYNWFVSLFWQSIKDLPKDAKWPSVFDLDKIWCRSDESNKHKAILHANAIDTARDGLKNAIKSARAAKKAGVGTAKFAWRTKAFRTTMWNGLHTTAKVENGILYINGRDERGIEVKLPPHLAHITKENLAVGAQISLVYDRNKHTYYWHFAIDDGRLPEEKPGDNILAGDMGEIHPIVLANSKTVCVLTARELRAQTQYKNKRLASLQSEQAKYNKGSNRWRKIQRRKAKFLNKQRRIEKDILHKVSRKVVDIARLSKTGEIVLGDIRKISDGKRLRKEQQQKIANWQHGVLRNFITYKAGDYSIEVTHISEKYTSQTCPNCGARHKPSNRNYNCPECGFRGHRDGVGAINIYSNRIMGEVGKVKMPKTMYLRVYKRSSPRVTRQVVR